MKKVTVKEYFANLFGGLWQAVLWVARLFGYKDESSYAKVLKRIFATCVTLLMVLFTGCVVFVFAKGLVYDELIRPRIDNRVWDEKYISNHLVFQEMYYSDEKRVYDKSKHKVLLKNLDWVVVSADKDSLAVFARNGKRGYLNRFTGEVVIPETYTRAWIFSEGLAAVEKDGELLFIDHSGKVVIDKDFQVYFDDPKYAFQKGYCIIKNPVNGKMGLIDRAGNWVLNPEYDSIFNNEGFWQVEKDDRVGLYTAQMDQMFPVENTAISVSENGIEVRRTDHTAKWYDLEGHVVSDFVIDEISNLRYETKELRHDVAPADDGSVEDKIYKIANCQQYLVRSGNENSSDYYGLLDRNGKIITPPIYTWIEAIDQDLYLCQPYGVLINGEGEVVQ